MQEFSSLVEEVRAAKQNLPGQPRFFSSVELSTHKAREAALFKNISSKVNHLFSDSTDDLLFFPAARSLITLLPQQTHADPSGSLFYSDLGSMESEPSSYGKIDQSMGDFIHRIDDTRAFTKQQPIEDLVESAALDRERRKTAFQQGYEGGKF